MTERPFTHEGRHGNPPLPPGRHGGYLPREAWTPCPTSGPAITAMVLGIVGIVAFVIVPFIGVAASIAALVFAFVALHQIRQRNLAGRGFAIAGMVLGWVGVGLLLVVVVVALSIPA